MVFKSVSSLKVVFLLSVLLIACIAKVTVYSPKELKNRVTEKLGKENNQFDVSIANFGIIQYGHSLIGRIYYDPSNPTGCEPFDEFDFSGDPDDSKHPSPIILVDRGNCTFVRKVRNIEHAGGSLGIVIDHSKEDVKTVIMSDDGTGLGINIPSLLISKGDGQILKDFLKEHHVEKYIKKDSEDEDDLTDKEKEDKRLIQRAALSVTFEFPHPDNRVEYDIWYTSTEDKALDFIVDFEKYDELLDDKVLMTPHFVTWSCTFCDDEYKKANCYGDGEYCSIGRPKSHKITGQDILQEDLRQHCVYTLYKNKHSVFWDYIQHVHTN